MKPKNKYFVGLCPFHSEKTASFFVYPESESFYCFGCSVGGDVITFTKLIEKIEYKQAIILLSERSKIELDDKDNELLYTKRIIYEINRQSAIFFYKNLKKNKFALEYLNSRGILTKTIKHFGIGYTNNNVNKKNEVVKFLKMKNFSDEEIIASGIAFKDKNNVLIDRFFGRIMFPIINSSGNILGFGARTLNDKIIPKYLNTSETTVFKKGHNLFNLNNAKKLKDNIILVEGYMDVISLWQIGFNSCATLGTSFTPYQSKLISNLFTNIYLCFDSDEAGSKATEKAIDIFQKNNISTKILVIGNFKDPDEFVNKNRENSESLFKKIFDNAQNDIWYLISKSKNKFNFNFYNEKIKFFEECTKIISKINNSIARDVCVTKICNKFNINKSAFLEQINKIIGNNNFSNNKNDDFKLSNKIKKNVDENKINRIKYIEKLLLSYIIKNGVFVEKIDKLLKRLENVEFVNNFEKQILGKISILKNQDRKICLTTVIEDFSIEQSGYLIKIINEQFDISFNENEIDEYIKILKKEKKFDEFKQNRNSSLEEILRYIDLIKDDKK